MQVGPGWTAEAQILPLLAFQLQMGFLLMHPGGATAAWKLLALQLPGNRRRLSPCLVTAL